MHLRFSPKIRLLGAAPNPPARAAYAALPNAPQVERLRALAGAEYGRFNQQGYASWFETSGRTRSRPVRGVGKDRHCRFFSGVWVPAPNKRFAGVCTLMHCLPRLFSVGLGVPPRMETAPA